MSDAVFLTGGTGFLGMELISRLLEREEGPEIFLAVRAADTDEADDRVARVLAQLYEDPPATASRLHPVRADLTASGMGLAAADRRALTAEIDRVVHCAAAISFTLPLDEARAINVDGTRRVLELASEVGGLERLVHVSTAYVCGRLTGPFAEDDPAPGEGFRNTYEQTKWEAEQLVNEAELPTAIVRPSVVVGESQGGWTSAFNVIYWPLQAFARGLLSDVPADPEGLIDLVPVDYVAELIDGVLFDPEVSGAFHAVAGEHAMTVSQLIERTCSALDREPPQLTDPNAMADDDPTAQFAGYFDIHTVFGNERARGVVANGGGPNGGAPPEPESYFRTLLDYGEHTRWGKSPLTRQAARARVAASDAAPSD
jgi:long-chain acyl-CoA synthetase